MRTHLAREIFEWQEGRASVALRYFSARAIYKQTSHSLRTGGIEETEIKRRRY